MTANNRTDKSFKNLASFSEKVLVVCPHCRQQATVFADLGKYTIPYAAYAKATFKCTHCLNKVEPGRWFGPVIIEPVNANCGYCGAAMRCRKTVNAVQKTMQVTCAECGKTGEYETRHTSKPADSTQATDPYFGLQLWLQAPFGSDIFWAYNNEHLQYIKEYVSSKLREAQPGGKYALTWKLPNFIKLAKNRDKILKLITKLETNINI